MPRSSKDKDGDGPSWQGRPLRRRDVLRWSALPLVAGATPEILMAEVDPKWHLDDGSFRNNYIGSIAKPFSELRKAFDAERPPVISFPLAKNDPAFLRSNSSERTATWIGHCTFLLQFDGLNILTDPHFTSRASPVSFAGPKRTTPVGLALEDVPKLDAVLISHNHYDHLDFSSVKMVKEHSPDATFFVPLKLGYWFRREGAENVVELDWWQEGRFKDATITSVPTQHWSNRLYYDRNKTLWCGFVIDTGSFRFLFIGDTGYSRDFVDIKERFGGFDLAAIPIGAYNPRWFMKDAHQNPEEAVQCMLDLNAKRALATHWGTFQLTFEEMDEPPRRLAAARAEAGLGEEDFVAMEHGETLLL